MAKYIRVRISDDVHYRFKVHCVKRSLSFAKQLSELVRKFVEVCDQNESLIGR